MFWDLPRMTRFWIASKKGNFVLNLLNIADPNKLARKPLVNGALSFPFFTIENVEIVDDSHIVVGNDNNLPFSAGRALGKADDNEFVLLEVGEFLNAR